MQFDIMFIGPATRDINIDYTGQTVREIGGAVYFCTYAARAAGATPLPRSRSARRTTTSWTHSNSPPAKRPCSPQRTPH